MSTLFTSFIPAGEGLFCVGPGTVPGGGLSQFEGLRRTKHLRGGAEKSIPGEEGKARRSRESRPPPVTRGLCIDIIRLVAGCGFVGVASLSSISPLCLVMILPKDDTGSASMGFREAHDPW